MDYGEVLSKAWKIVWKFKVLWIFGIFAGCGTRSGGSYNGGSSGYQFDNRSPSLPPGFLHQMERLVRFLENPALIAGLIGIVCLLVLASIFIGTIGRIGLMKGTLDADNGAERLTFGGVWSASLPYFWRVFWLSVLVGLPFFILVALLLVGGVLLFLAPGSNANVPGSAYLVLISLACVLACVTMLLSLLIGFIAQQAQNAIVIEDESILGSLRRGWEVLTKNIGPILIVAIILWVIALVAGIALAIPVFIIFFSAVFPVLLSGASSNGQFPFAPLIVGAALFLLYLPVSMLVNGILMAYIQSVWTLTYLRLTKPKPDIPIVQTVNA